MTRYYVGLSTSGHDPAIALVNESGEVLFAEATERFLQDKRAWGAAPDHHAHLERALAPVDLRNSELVVATTWKGIKDEGPTKAMDTLLPKAAGEWLRAVQREIHKNAGINLARRLGLSSVPDRRDYEHHLCHAAFAAYSSPFDDALCLVVDGEGDVGAVSLYRYASRHLKRVWRSWGPGSLGSFYTWLTGMCGFDWMLGEEWKVMGLAAFGQHQPELVALMQRMLIVEDGRVLLASSDALQQTMAELASTARAPGEPLMSAADLAASGQFAFSLFADQILAACVKLNADNLILTGGCALNSSYNGTIAPRLGFRSVFIPCAPGDDGNAVGAALLAWLQDHPGSMLPKARQQGTGTAFLGSSVDDRAVQSVLRGSSSAHITDLGPNSSQHLAKVLRDGKIVGVMRGNAEFGPRALGHRSILADPRPIDMKSRINDGVKSREPYRPLAPMIPIESAADWFRDVQPSPYMSFALPWREEKRSLVPAVLHEDGTGRLQTVERTEDPWLHSLLLHFEAETSVPVLLNTSFNVMGKPIVDTVQDAMAVLMTTELDAVLLNNILVEKHVGRT